MRSREFAPHLGPNVTDIIFWLKMVREGPISISNSKISCFNKFSRFCDIRFPAMRFRHIEITKDFTNSGFSHVSNYFCLCKQVFTDTLSLHTVITGNRVEMDWK